MEEKVTLTFFNFLTLKRRRIIKVYRFIADIKAKFMLKLDHDQIDGKAKIVLYKVFSF